MNIEKLKLELLAHEEGGRERVYTLLDPNGLTNIEQLLNIVSTDKIEGDFVETGVWKGGACIWAKIVINELKLKSKVYVCDSFMGLPPPDEKNFPADAGDSHYTHKELGISKKEVMNNFEKFGVLDDKVIFIEGYFKDTMPILREKISSIAILRVDGDMYESTIEVLNNLYDKVSSGGFIILDDYCLRRSRMAIEDFRKKENISEPLIMVQHPDRTPSNPFEYIAYWRKP